jgi:hypothetical protein
MYYFTPTGQKVDENGKSLTEMKQEIKKENFEAKPRQTPAPPKSSDADHQKPWHHRLREHAKKPVVFVPMLIILFLLIVFLIHHYETSEKST